MKRIVHPRGGHRGYTLPEAMLSVLVVALVCIMFSRVFLTSQQAQTRSQHMEQATQAAHEELESWRQVGFNSLPAITSGQSVTHTSTPPDELPSATRRVVFTKLDVALAPTTAETGRRGVEVTVTWAGVGSDRGTVIINSLITSD